MRAEKATYSDMRLMLRGFLLRCFRFLGLMRGNRLL